MKRLFITAGNKWIIVISLAMTLCLFLILRRIDGVISGGGGLGVVHLQFAFIKDYFIPVIASWGATGIDLFLKTIWLDFIIPPCYALLLSSIYSSVVIGGQTGDPMLIRTRDLVNFTVPFSAAAFDYIENVIHIIILTRRWYFDSLIAAGSIASLIKWALLAYIILWLLVTYLRRSKNNAYTG